MYGGQEDNAFYRRSPHADGRLTESGGKELTTGDVLVLGDDAIHSVTNPRRTITAAIHVYGGDFVNQPRSQWGPGERLERPFDMAEVIAFFFAGRLSCTRRMLPDCSVTMSLIFDLLGQIGATMRQLLPRVLLLLGRRRWSARRRCRVR